MKLGITFAAVAFCAISLSPCYAATDDYQCQIGNDTLNIGDSMWVPDPALKEMGAGQDWSGFRVVCRASVKKAIPTGQPGSVVKTDSAVLVLSEISDDYYQHVTNHPEGKKE